MNDWTSGDVVANGITLRYHRTGGDKPVLVLVHGLTDNGLCWAPIARALEDEYDIIMYDARGHGLSDAPAEGYSTADHAADLLGLIDALGLRDIRLLGHSMGASTVTAVTVQAPEWIVAVAVEDPPWYRGGTESIDQRRQTAAEWSEWLREAHTRTHAEMVAQCRVENPRWIEDECGPWATAKLQARPLVHNYLSAPRFDWHAALGQIKRPLLLITGDPDQGALVTAEVAREVTDRAADARVAHFADAGHSIRREQRDRYVNVVRDFFRRQY